MIKSEAALFLAFGISGWYRTNCLLYVIQTLSHLSYRDINSVAGLSTCVYPYNEALHKLHGA